MRRVTRLISAIAIVAACMAATPAVAQTRERIVVSMNGIYQTGTSALASAGSFAVNAETATFSTNFPVKAGPAFDASARYNVRGALAVGVAVTQFTASADAEITGKIPHPFFFNQARSIAGTAALTREETAVRVELVLHSAPGRKLQFSAFAGPAFFAVKQGLIDAVSYTDSYPYDTAAFGQATVRTASTSKTGFAAGGDVSYYFSKTIGIGATAAIAKATVSLSASDGSSLSVNVGGTQAGAGIRFRF